MSKTYLNCSRHGEVPDGRAVRTGTTCHGRCPWCGSELIEAVDDEVVVGPIEMAVSMDKDEVMEVESIGKYHSPTGKAVAIIKGLREHSDFRLMSVAKFEETNANYIKQLSDKDIAIWALESQLVRMKAAATRYQDSTGSAINGLRKKLTSVEEVLSDGADDLLALYKELCSILNVTPVEGAGGCPVHAGQVHGGEASELRNGLEKILEVGCGPNNAIQNLLDGVDARDSLAHEETASTIEHLRGELEAERQANVGLREQLKEMEARKDEVNASRHEIQTQYGVAMKDAQGEAARWKAEVVVSEKARAATDAVLQLVRDRSDGQIRNLKSRNAELLSMLETHERQGQLKDHLKAIKAEAETAFRRFSDSNDVIALRGRMQSVMNMIDKVTNG